MGVANRKRRVRAIFGTKQALPEVMTCPQRFCPGFAEPDAAEQALLQTRAEPFTRMLQ